MKIFSICFEPMRPVPAGCIMAAKSKEDLLNFLHTNRGSLGRTPHSKIKLEDIQEIDLFEYATIFYEDGDY